MSFDGRKKWNIILRTILPEEPLAYNYAEIVINIQYETPNQMGRALSVTDEIKTANNYCLLECIKTWTQKQARAELDSIKCNLGLR